MLFLGRDACTCCYFIGYTVLPKFPRSTTDNQLRGVPGVASPVIYTVMYMYILTSMSLKLFCLRLQFSLIHVCFFNPRDCSKIHNLVNIYISRQILQVMKIKHWDYHTHTCITKIHILSISASKALTVPLSPSISF